MAVFIVFAVLFALFFFYTENYYHADRTAVMMLRTDEYAAVTSSQTGLLFDGPGEEDLLIFYPGAKVQETAYAPLMRQIAEGGMDGCIACDTLVESRRGKRQETALRAARHP